MAQNTEEDKRQNSGNIVTVIKRTTGSFRDTTALMADRVEPGRKHRNKASRERRAAGKAAPKVNLYPDAYHNRIDGMRRMIVRRGFLPDDECKAFAEMLSNAMIRNRALEGKHSSPVILARWLRKELPAANRTMLADVAARACREPQSYIPKEAIGRILKHTFEEAKAIGIAKTIYPFDVAPDEYEKFLTKLRRARANIGRRKVDRDTYEGNSIAALARRHGVKSRSTIYAWIKAGILDRQTGQLNRSASLIIGDTKRRIPVQQPVQEPAGLTPAAPPGARPCTIPTSTETPEQQAEAETMRTTPTPPPSPAEEPGYWRSVEDELRRWDLDADADAPLPDGPDDIGRRDDISPPDADDYSVCDVGGREILDRRASILTDQEPTPTSEDGGEGPSAPEGPPPAAIGTAPPVSDAIRAKCKAATMAALQRCRDEAFARQRQRGTLRHPAFREGAA